MKIVQFNSGWNALRRNFLCLPWCYQYLDIVDFRSGAINWRLRSDWSFNDCLQSEPDVRKAADGYAERLESVKAAARAKTRYGRIKEIINPSFCEKIRLRLVKLVTKAA